MNDYDVFFKTNCIEVPCDKVEFANAPSNQIEISINEESVLISYDEALLLSKEIKKLIFNSYTEQLENEE